MLRFWLFFRKLFTKELSVSALHFVLQLCFESFQTILFNYIFLHGIKLSEIKVEQFCFYSSMAKLWEKDNKLKSGLENKTCLLTMDETVWMKCCLDTVTVWRALVSPSGEVSLINQAHPHHHPSQTHPLSPLTSWRTRGECLILRKPFLEWN